VMYGVLRSDDGFMRASIEFVGDKCGVMMRSRATTDKNQVSKLMGSIHFSFTVDNVADLISQVEKTEATDSSGHKALAFTGIKRRVGQLEVPEWEKQLYRDTWKEISGLSNEELELIGIQWVRAWHDDGKLNWEKLTEEDRIKLLRKIRNRIKRVPEDVVPKPMRRVIRRVCNHHRDGDYQLEADELECLVKVVAMFEAMCQMATEPETIALAVDQPQFLEVGVAVNIGAPIVTPDEALTGLDFRVEPALPAGLVLNADGSITGAPTETAEQGSYKVVASNKAGEVGASLTLRVRIANMSSAHARSYEERDANYPDSNEYCQIAAGELGCHKVYEDDLIIAFLEINPASMGHTVVTPKKLYQSLDVCPPDVLVAIMTALPKLAIRACDAVGAKDYAITSYNGSAAGQKVFNTHFHIIPCLDNNDLQIKSWSPQSVTDEELARVAAAMN